MSRLSTSSGRSSAARVRRVLVFRHVGDAWYALSAAMEGSLRIVSSEQVSAFSAEAVRSLIDRHKPDRVVYLMPGSSAITRVVELPSGTDEERLGALELIAEAQLPSNIAEYRRGYGLLPERSGSDHHAGMICGWIGDRPTQKALLAGRDGVASEAVALMWLLDPNASDALAVIADPDQGAISIGAMRDHRPFVRAVRETPGDASAWEGVVQRTLAESGLQATDLAWCGGPSGPRLALDESSLARLAARTTGGSLSDRGWLARYGPSIGAALAVTGRTPTGNLFGLLDEAPKPRLNPVQRVAVALSDRRIAVAALIVGVLLCFAVPVLTVWARASVLAEKVARSMPQEEGIGDPGVAERMVRLRGVMYDELSSRRWPVMKMLSDIAGTMPVGVQAENISISGGDRITLRGVAQTSAQANDFISRLTESGVFRVEPGRREITARGTEFDLSLIVAQPFATPTNLEDFRTETLAVRLYGEEGAEMVRAALEAGTVAQTTPGRGGTTGRAGAGGAGSSREPTFQGGSRAEQAEPVPEPLSSEAIAKMDRAETMREFGARFRASGRDDLDSAVKSRLQDEIAQLRQRLQEISQQGGR